MRRTMQTTSFGQKIFAGSMWTVLMRWMSRLLGIISMIILARILVPEDYGLVAQAVLLSSFLELMTQFGFFTALLRDKDANSDDYHTAFTLSLIRGLVLAVVVAASAGLVADFFDEPRLTDLVLVYAGVTFLNGTVNVGIVDFQKEFRFNEDFKLNITSRFSGFLVTLMIAVIYESYWAFPLGTLVATLVKVFCSYHMVSFKPRIALKNFYHIFNFSKWFFLFEAFNAASNKVDTFLIGKFGSPAELGIYTVSKEVAGLPTTELAMPVARASLPVLARHVDDLPEFGNLYTSVLISVLVLALPAVAGISVLSEHLVLLLLGPRWSEAATLLPILAFIAVTKVSVACAIPALAALGRASLLSRYSVTMLIVKSLLMGAGIMYYGVIGLAWGALAAGILGVLMIHFIQRKLGILSLGRLFAGLWRSILATATMAAVVASVKVNYPADGTQANMVITPLLVMLGCSVYMVSLMLLWVLAKRPDGFERNAFNLMKNMVK